jgi:hypothetical protein
VSTGSSHSHGFVPNTSSKLARHPRFHGDSARRQGQRQRARTRRRVGQGERAHPCSRTRTSRWSSCW